MSGISSNQINISCWMEDLFEVIKDKTLSQISILGSRQSAMSVTKNCFPGIDTKNTQLQYLNIYEQLEAGVRYFDIRPIFNKTSTGYNYLTGNFSKDQKLGFQGCYGEPIKDVLSAVLRFLARYKNEFIILDFDHYLHKEEGVLTDSFTTITGFPEYVTETLSSVLFTIPTLQKPISNFTLKEILSHGNVFTRYGKIAASKTEKGIFSKNALSIYNEPTHTIDLDVMKKDQWEKFEKALEIRTENYSVETLGSSKTDLDAFCPNIIRTTLINKNTTNLYNQGNFIEELKVNYLVGQYSNKKLFIRSVDTDENGNLYKKNKYEAFCKTYYDLFATYTTHENTYLIGFSKEINRLFIASINVSNETITETYSETCEYKFDTLITFQTNSKWYLCGQEKQSKCMLVFELDKNGLGMGIVYNEKWDNFYDTLQTFIYVNKTYIVGQSSFDNAFFMREIGLKEIVSKTYTYQLKWKKFYNTLSVFEFKNRVFVNGQCEQDKSYYLDEIVLNDSKDGLTTKEIDYRYWNHYYPVLITISKENKITRFVQRVANKNLFAEEMTLHDLFLLAWTVEIETKHLHINKTKRKNRWSSLFGFRKAAKEIIEIEKLISTINSAAEANNSLAIELEERINTKFITANKLPNIILLDYCNANLSKQIIKLNLE